MSASNLRADLVETFLTAKRGDEFRFELVKGETVAHLAGNMRATLKQMKCKGDVRISGRGVHVVYNGYYKESKFYQPVK